MTSAPKLVPTSVTGRVPCARSSSACASSIPATLAAFRHTPHGLSITDAAVSTIDGSATDAANAANTVIWTTFFLPYP
jgi:hypothetical protein